MRSDGPQIQRLVRAMSTQIAASGADDTEGLFLRLNRLHPGDVGCLCVFFMRYLRLARGQAVFIAPGVPHAYLSGQVLECMAASDNVVRAGLTPKPRDVAVLLGILRFSPSPLRDLIVHPKGGWFKVYESAAEEFTVFVAELTEQFFDERMFRGNQTIKILLCLQGEALLDAAEGAFLLTAGASYLVQPHVAFRVRGSGAPTTIAGAF